MSRIEHVWSLVDASVGQISRCQRSHFTSTVEYGVVTRVVALVCECHAGTNLYHLINNVVDIGTSTITIHLVMLQKTLIDHSRQRDAEVGLLVTATDAGLIVLRGRVLHEEVIPVNKVATRNQVSNLVIVVTSNRGLAKYIVVSLS